MSTIKHWLEEHPEFTVTETRHIGHSVDEDGWEHTAYELTLEYEGRQMVMPYNTGLGITDSPEDVPWNILDCVVCDTLTYRNAGSFEEYCSEFAIDSDSRKAHRDWKQLGKFAEQAIALLGIELLEDLAWNYERL